MLAFLLLACSDNVVGKRFYTPEVAIMAPLEGERAWRDAPTPVIARVDDADTPDPSLLTLSWSTDNGTIETAATAEDGTFLATWTPARDGSAEIRVLVVDPDAIEAEDSVSVEVVTNQRPTVTLLAPEDGEVLRQDRSATLRAEADDDGGANALTVEWTLDGDALSGCDTTTPDGLFTCAVDAFAVAGEGLELCAVVTDAFGMGASDCARINVVACVDADGDGTSTCDGDCDDDDASVYPDAEEACDGSDNDCDGAVDESGARWYADADRDGYGDPGVIAEACSAPSGFVINHDDCDDARADVSPADPEVCDGADNDCDGSVDEGVTVTFHADADTDGYGDPGVSADACAAPRGYVANDEDCDDARADISPADLEVCDGADNDCDGTVDEGVTSTFHVDADSDGYGDPDVTVDACAAPSGYVVDGTDCDDTDPAVNPGVSSDTTDGVDADCDGADADCGSATRYVPAEYAAIQDAIDASCEGDRIEVSAGTYPEDIDTDGKTLEIVGVDGSAATAIVGTGTDSVVTMNVAGTLEGFTVTGGEAWLGGGIFVDAVRGTVRLADLEVSDNVATSDGGGIFLGVYSTAALVAEDLYVHDNAAGTGTFANYGGGAYVGGDTSVTGVWSRVRFESNLAGVGGAVCFNGSMGMASEMEDASFVGNTSSLGAVLVNSSTVATLHQAEFLDNVGTALFVNYGAEVEVSNVVFAGNTARGYGVVANSLGTLYLENSVVVGNAGAGLYCYLGSTELVNVDISYNDGYAFSGDCGTDLRYGNYYGNSGVASVMASPVGRDGNISVEPGYVSYGVGLNAEDWDLHLHPSSALIDAGSTTMSDSDGTSSDIGAYGGPDADSAGYYADADADGLYDGWEEIFGLDPATDDGLLDTDGDGLDNVSEFDAGTWPDVADTDGDGMDDGAEVSAGRDPLA